MSMTPDTFNKFQTLHYKIDNYLEPLLLLATRLYIGSIFLLSGWIKANNWESTLYFYANDNPIYGFPAVFLSGFFVIAELVLGAFLFVGFAARYTALALIVLTLIVSFSYIHVTEYNYWILLLGFIVARGAGELSADQLIANQYRRTYVVS